MKRSDSKELHFPTISLPTNGMDIKRSVCVINYCSSFLLQSLPSYYLFQVKKVFNVSLNPYYSKPTF